MLWSLVLSSIPAFPYSPFYYVGLAACRLHLPDSFASWSALAFCKEEVLVGNTGRWEKGGDGSSGSSWCGFAAGAAFAAGAGASDEPRVAVGAARRGSSFWSPDAALAVSVSPVYSYFLIFIIFIHLALWHWLITYRKMANGKSQHHAMSLHLGAKCVYY